MPDVLHTLTIRNGESVKKDLLADFDFVCLAGASYPHVGKFKDLEKTSWYDEDGDDVYIPETLRAESIELEIPIGCEGDGASDKVRAKLDALTNFLSGRSGALDAGGLGIYMPFEEKGFNGCYLKEIKDTEYQKMGAYEILCCSLVFGVANPMNTYDGR